MKLFAHAVVVELAAVIGALLGVATFIFGAPSRVVARLQGKR